MTKYIETAATKAMSLLGPVGFATSLVFDLAGYLSDNKAGDQAKKDLGKVLSGLSELDLKLSDGFASRNVARGADIRKREVEVRVISEGIDEKNGKKGFTFSDDKFGTIRGQLSELYEKEIKVEKELLKQKIKELNDLKKIQNPKSDLEGRTPAARTDISQAMKESLSSEASTSPSIPTGTSDPRLAQLNALQVKITEVVGGEGASLVGMTKAMDDLKIKMGEVMGKLKDGITHPKLNPNGGSDGIGGAFKQVSAAKAGGAGMSTGVVAALVSTDTKEDPVAPATEGVEKLDDVFKDLGERSSNIFEQMALSGDASAKRLINSFKQLALSTLFQKLIPMMFGVPAGSVPGLATGGRANAGQPYIVGEHGPELMIPGSVGTVKPSLNGVGGGGNANITQNINFTTDVKNTVRAEVLNAAPHIQQQAVQAVFEHLRRGRRYI